MNTAACRSNTLPSLHVLLYHALNFACSNCAALLHLRWASVDNTIQEGVANQMIRALPLESTARWHPGAGSQQRLQGPQQADAALQAAGATLLRVEQDGQVQQSQPLQLLLLYTDCTGLGVLHDRANQLQVRSNQCGSIYT